MACEGAPENNGASQLIAPPTHELSTSTGNGLHIAYLINGSERESSAFVSTDLDTFASCDEASDTVNDLNLIVEMNGLKFYIPLDNAEEINLSGFYFDILDAYSDLETVREECRSQTENPSSRQFRGARMECQDKDPSLSFRSYCQGADDEETVTSREVELILQSATAEAVSIQAPGMY